MCALICAHSAREPVRGPKNQQGRAEFRYSGSAENLKSAGFVGGD